MDDQPLTTTSQQDDNTPQKDWDSASDEEILNADLITALGLETLSDEDKSALIDEMTSTVQMAVAKRVLDELDPPGQQELESLLSENDSDKLNQFLLINSPGFSDSIQDETVKFKRAMLTGTVNPANT